MEQPICEYCNKFIAPGVDAKSQCCRSCDCLLVNHHDGHCSP